MSVLHLVHQPAAIDRDPLGYRHPWIDSVVDDAGTRTPSVGPLSLGISLNTGRILVPGDRVTFRCEGTDPHGRELRWWVHPFGVHPAPPIRGRDVELTWVVEPVSAGPRVYVGIGMAAESRHHRQGGLDDQGYDGWVVYYYQVTRRGPVVIAPIHQCRPAVGTPDDGDDTGIENLWKMFAEASRSGSAGRIAAAEDAVFRHYLPWARSLAAAASPRHPNASTLTEYRDAAEIGLAQAILAWRRTDTGHFTDFARRLILRRLRRLGADVAHRRVHGAYRGPREIPLDAATIVDDDGPAAGPPAGVDVALLDYVSSLPGIRTVERKLLPEKQPP